MFYRKIRFRLAVMKQIFTWPLKQKYLIIHCYLSYFPNNSDKDQVHRTKIKKLLNFLSFIHSDILKLNILLNLRLKILEVYFGNCPPSDRYKLYTTYTLNTNALKFNLLIYSTNQICFY